MHGERLTKRIESAEVAAHAPEPQGEEGGYGFGAAHQVVGDRQIQVAMGE